jgi:hypothetical protein
MRVMLTVCVLVLAIAGCEQKAASPKGAAAPSSSAVISPQERLDASLKVYRKAKTYRDEGTAVATQEGGPSFTLPFSTAFERGGRFTFEFRFGRDPVTGIASTREINRTGAVWSSDGKIFTFQETPGGANEHGTAYLQIAKATGISGGTAGTLLPLLVGGTASIEKLSDLKDAGQETVDGIECWKVAGATQLPGYSMTLWIGGDGLVRRVRHEIEHDFSKSRAFEGKPVPPRSTATTTISFKPVLNEESIDSSRFEVE